MASFPGQPVLVLRKQVMMGWQWHQLDHIQTTYTTPDKTTTQAPHHSIFTGQMLFLKPNQQCQSTDGNRVKEKRYTSSQRILTRGHVAGRFFIENSMWNSTASVTGQWQRCSAACGKIPTSYLDKIAPSHKGHWTLPNTELLGPTQLKTCQTASRDWFSHFCRAQGGYRQTDRHTDYASPSVVIGGI